jgi:hypothetical protein
VTRPLSARRILSSTEGIWGCGDQRDTRAVAESDRARPSASMNHPAHRDPAPSAVDIQWEGIATLNRRLYGIGS